jgi:hypothetical protein
MADLASSSAVPEQAIDDSEEMHVEVKNSVHQRLRANSSIMQLKKLLGTSRLDFWLSLSLNLKKGCDPDVILLITNSVCSRQPW